LWAQQRPAARQQADALLRTEAGREREHVELTLERLARSTEEFR
jgi:hypothetical protein